VLLFPRKQQLDCGYPAVLMKYYNLSATPQMSYYSGQQLMALTHHYVVTLNRCQRSDPAFLIPETLDTVPFHCPTVQINDADIHIGCPQIKHSDAVLLYSSINKVNYIHFFLNILFL